MRPQANASFVDVAPAAARTKSFFTSSIAVAGIALAGLIGGAVVGVADLTALYLCTALIAIAFILRDFRVGVVLLILLMPISRSSMFPHSMLGITGLNPLNLLLVGTLVSYFAHAMSAGGLRRFLPRELLLLYILPIVLAGLNGSQHVSEIVPGFIYYGLLDFRDSAGYLLEMVFKPMSLVVYALLVGAAVTRTEKPERFFGPMLISLWIISLVVLWFVVSSGIALNELANSESREFFSALGLHANELGHLYAPVFGLLLFTWSAAEDGRLKIVLFISMMLVLGSLMLTFSRSAFSGVAVVALIYALTHRNVKTLAIGVIVVALALFALPDAVYDRIAYGSGEGLNAISAGRIEWLWLPLLPEVLKSPIWGSGLGSILWSEPMRLGAGGNVLIVTHPHNAYLEALLDLGILGLVLLCTYFFTVWKGFRRLALDPAISPTLRGFYLGAAAGLIGLLIADIPDSSLAPRTEQAFLWFAIGMMYGQRVK